MTMLQPFEIIYLSSALFLGLASSLHCVGMCGPIALTLPVGRLSFNQKILSISLYNIGRVITYTLLGLLIGGLGYGLSLFKWQQTFSILLGVMLLLTLLPYYKYKLTLLPFYFSKLKQILTNALSRDTNKFFFITGLANGLLPCGAIYIALAGALSANRLDYGMLYMLFFGIGTFPLMFLVNLYSGQFKTKLLFNFKNIIPILTLVMALLLILRGLNLDIPFLSPNFHSTVSTDTLSCH
jgi:sulfite exporter TauE/SafE